MKSNEQCLEKKFANQITSDPIYAKLLLNKNTCKKNSDIEGDIDWIENSDKISSIFNKIPTNHIYESKKAIEVERKKNYKKINKKYVHKNRSENVIISTPTRIGSIYYFYMFPDTKEFSFDHKSDHFQGILLMEGTRQAGLATVHLNGLDLDGRMNLTKMHTDFNNYVELNAPVIIRSISNPIKFAKEKNTTNIFCIAQVIQFGKICATTTFGSIGFRNKKNIEEFRTKSLKINTKRKDRHSNLLNNYKNA